MGPAARGTRPPIIAAQPEFKFWGTTRHPNECLRKTGNPISSNMEITAKHQTHKPHFKAVNYAIPALLLCLVAWVLYKFDFFRSDYATDNAQIRRQIAPINSRVQGYVRDISFQEYTHVTQGNVLFVIDDSEYTLRLAQAEANDEMAAAGRDVMQTSIDTMRNNLLVSDSGIAEIRARLENAEADLKRYTALLAKQRDILKKSLGILSEPPRSGMPRSRP